MRDALVLVLSLIMASAWAADRPDDFVDAADVVPGLVVEARYAGYYDFVGRPIDGYEAPVCLLTRPVAEALARVQATLKPFGLGLKVFDCYRPARANRLFLSSVMQLHGFRPYPYEWWPFTRADEPYPDTDFDFTVKQALDGNLARRGTAR